MGDHSKPNVDPQAVEEMAILGYNDQEIAADLGCSADYLVKYFKDVLDVARKAGDSVNEKVVDKLARELCTDDEIAAVVGVHRRTLQRKYAQLIKRARQMGRSSLRSRQYTVAMSGNVTMLIWLGKNELGQADKLEGARPQDSDADAVEAEAGDEEETFDWNEYGRLYTDFLSSSETASNRKPIHTAHPNAKASNLPHRPRA